MLDQSTAPTHPPKSCQPRVCAGCPHKPCCPHTSCCPHKPCCPHKSWQAEHAPRAVLFSCHVHRTTTSALVVINPAWTHTHEVPQQPTEEHACAAPVTQPGCGECMQWPAGTLLVGRPNCRHFSLSACAAIRRGMPATSAPHACLAVSERRLGGGVWVQPSRHAAAVPAGLTLCCTESCGTAAAAPGVSGRVAPGCAWPEGQTRSASSSRG